MVLAAAMGCGQNSLPQREAPVGTPPGTQSPAAPSETALTALTGEYRLLDIDGEAVEAGTLSIVESDDGVGVVYAATLSGATYGRRLLTPRSKTTVTLQDAKVHQKFEEGEHKTTLDYEQNGNGVSVEIIECSPGACLVSVLSGSKN